MRNPIKSEFFTFNPADSGMQGENGFFTLNVGGAREIVITTSRGETGGIDWVISNQSYNELVDVTAGVFRGKANFLPIINGVQTLIVHSNDEYLTLCLDPTSEGNASLHVWVIR